MRNLRQDLEFAYETQRRLAGQKSNGRVSTYVWELVMEAVPEVIRSPETLRHINEEA